MNNREVAIVHYNTPELIEAAILSLRKHGGSKYHVTVFDNSTERPFKKKMKGVSVIDNTKGQIIDFDKELAKFPNKCREVGCAKNIEFGSDKHMMSIQKLWELIPQGFLLMDSDVLIQDDVDFMFNEEECCVGHIQTSRTSGNPYDISRLMPVLCWINVPMCVAGGAKYFDPTRCWGLVENTVYNKNNWYDTGASFLEDIKTLKPQCHGLRIDIRPLMLHYANGSWLKNNVSDHIRWIEEHRDLWEPVKRLRTKKVALCAIGRKENRYAKEFVDHYLSLGFDKIFIYDNNQGDEEHFEEVLKGYRGKVKIIDWRNRRGHAQLDAYNDMYEKEGQNYQWIAFFDFDEHLELTQGGDIHDFLLQYDDADCLLLNWMMMTDSGNVRYEPKPLKERFTIPLDNERKDYAGNIINKHVKSIVRGGQEKVRFNGNPHIPSTSMRFVNAADKKVPQLPFQDIDYSVAFIRHYGTKTIEEWMDIKTKRRFPETEEFNRNWYEHHLDWFFCINERTEEKERLAVLSQW